MEKTMRKVGLMDLLVRKFTEYFLEKETDTETAQAEAVIGDFAGAYEIYMRDWEAYLSVRTYRNVDCTKAYEGQECGYIDISVYHSRGGMDYFRGYFSKFRGNVYTLSGEGMDGATIKVKHGGLVLCGIKEADGKYVRS